MHSCYRIVTFLLHNRLTDHIIIVTYHYRCTRNATAKAVTRDNNNVHDYPCPCKLRFCYLSHLTSYLQRSTSHLLHPTFCILHPTPHASYTLHPTSCVLHSTDCILQPISCIPYTLYPRPTFLHHYNRSCQPGCRHGDVYGDPCVVHTFRN